MNHYLLYANLRQRTATLPWPVDLTARHIVVLQAGGAREILQCCRAYPLMMVLLELPEIDDAVCAQVAEITAGATNGHVIPVVGIAQAPLTPEHRQALAAVGLVDVLHSDDPESFVLWRLETLTSLADLRRFEQAHMDVTMLASKTRTHLHDLSQPLSAVQGRLQLLAARCPGDDPQAKTYQELVRLIFEVTNQLMEIQQIHRQFS